MIPVSIPDPAFVKRKVFLALGATLMGTGLSSASTSSILSANLESTSLMIDLLNIQKSVENEELIQDFVDKQEKKINAEDKIVSIGLWGGISSILLGTYLLFVIISKLEIKSKE